jgi:hypothetical protein
MSRSRMPSAPRRLAAACVFAPALAAAASGAAAAAPPSTAGAAVGPAMPAGAAAAASSGSPAAAPTTSSSPAAAAPAPADRFGPGPGAFAVEAMDLDWLDQDRNRPVPVRVYFPKREPGPFPVVVFSSGLGAGRASFEFLGRHLASHGYVSVHVQHPGSDERIWQAGGDARETIKKTVNDPQTGLARLLDLVFALDQVAALASSSPVLRGRIDLRQVAVAGSNVGAWTALAAAGLAFAGKNGEESSLPDPRVKAALLLMPPPAAGPQRERLRFEHVKVPCLYLTAAAANESEAQAAARRLPFDQVAGAEQVLVTYVAAAADAGSPGPGTGAAAGKGRPARGPGANREAQLRDPVATIATAFLDARLRHDAAAREWLLGGGLAAYLGKSFRVETRTR